MNRLRHLSLLLCLVLVCTWGACLRLERLCQNDRDCETNFPKFPYCISAFCQPCSAVPCKEVEPAPDATLPESYLPESTAEEGAASDEKLQDVGPSSCKNDEECGAGSFCRVDRCVVDSCEHHRDCAVSQVCLDNKCVTAPNCPNTPCAAGTVCDEGKCVRCPMAACPAGQLCKEGLCVSCDGSALCDAQHQCQDGYCQPMKCSTSPECRGGFVCINARCTPCPGDAACDTTIGSKCTKGRCSISTKIDTDSSAALWADNTIASSCKEYFQPADPAYQPRGFRKLLIQPTPHDQPFAVYCLHAGTSFGEGWTSVLKIDGSAKSFLYDDPKWTNRNLLSPNSFDDKNTNKQEHKLASFYRVPVSEVLVQRNGQTEFIRIVLNKQEASLYHLFRKERFVSFQAQEFSWTTLFPMSKLPAVCSLWDGFNVRTPDPSGQLPRVRLGILGGGDESCAPPTAWLGIGGGGQVCGQESGISAGNATPDAANCTTPTTTSSLINVYVR